MLTKKETEQNVSRTDNSTAYGQVSVIPVGPICVLRQGSSRAGPEGRSRKLGQGVAQMYYLASAPICSFFLGESKLWALLERREP